MKIGIRPIGRESESILQKIFEATPDYFLKVDGVLPQKHFAKKEMESMPPVEKRAPAYEKQYCIISLDGKDMGALELHKNHPKEGISYIGLLLITPEYQGKGLGRTIYTECEKYIKKMGTQEIRIAVHERNDVTPFWEKMGFASNGHVSQWQGEKISGKIMEMTKPI